MVQLLGRKVDAGHAEAAHINAATVQSSSVRLACCCCANNLSLCLLSPAGEYVNDASKRPQELATLKGRLAELQPTLFQPVRTGGNTSRATEAAVARGGYWGPFIFP